MEYFRYTFFIRILAVVLAVVIQIDLFDSISFSYPESEVQQLDQTIDKMEDRNEVEGDLIHSQCHSLSLQKSRIQILHNNFHPNLSQMAVAMVQNFINHPASHFTHGEHHFLLTLFCVYRI